MSTLHEVILHVHHIFILHPLLICHHLLVHHLLVHHCLLVGISLLLPHIILLLTADHETCSTSPSSHRPTPLTHPQSSQGQLLPPHGQFIIIGNIASLLLFSKGTYPGRLGGHKSLHRLENEGFSTGLLERF